jgi:hypothetical protein
MPSPEFIIACLIALFGLCVLALIVVCAAVQAWRDYRFGRRNRRRRGYVLGGPETRERL